MSPRKKPNPQEVEANIQRLLSDYKNRLLMLRAQQKKIMSRDRD